MGSPFILSIGNIMTNKKAEKELRVCSCKGKYFLAMCLLDSDGEVAKILNDDVELAFNSLSELRDMTSSAVAALGKPVIHRNSCNSRLLREDV